MPVPLPALMVPVPEIEKLQYVREFVCPLTDVLIMVFKQTAQPLFVTPVKPRPTARIGTLAASFN